jgi:hypothetical protein
MHKCSFLPLTPLFLAFLSQPFRILFVAVHLFSSPVLRASSVASTLPPQTPFRLSGKLVPHSLPVYIGVSPPLVLYSPAKSLRLRACHSFWESSVCAVFLSYLQSHSTFIPYPNANPFSQECSCSTFRSSITCISHTCFQFSILIQKLRQALV